MTTHHVLSSSVASTGFFDADNVAFVQSKATQVLAREFRQRIVFDVASVKRVMMRVYSELLETVPQMNERVVMELTHEFRNHQLLTDQRLRYEEGYVASQMLFNPISKVAQVDVRAIKLHHGVGGTKGFVFI